MNPEHFVPRTQACERVRGRLDEALDGALAPLAAARDAGHVEACGACAAERERRARLLESARAALLASRGELELASQGLEARIARARAPAMRRLAAWGRPMRAAAIAASAIVALFLLQGVSALDVSLGDLFASSLRSAPLDFLPRPSWPPADFPGALSGE